MEARDLLVGTWLVGGLIVFFVVTAVLIRYAEAEVEERGLQAFRPKRKRSEKRAKAEGPRTRR